MRIPALLLLSLATLRLAAADEAIVYHEPRVAEGGGILPWYSPDPAVAYDHDLRLLWAFWKGMRLDPNGVPYYLQHQVWKEKEDDPRGLGGDQINMALSSWNLLYGYLGDESVKADMVRMATYWLAHGLSKPTDLWPNLPYPYNTEVHSGVYDGDMRAGKGFLQPDKAGAFGAELVTLYKMTGNPTYLDAAVRIADALADKAVAGDAERSPWPFRVHSGTGLLDERDKDGRHFRSSYTTNWTGALRLFEDLAALKSGRAEAYGRAHALVVSWLKAFPLRTNVWGPFFEDMDTWVETNTETNADTLAFHILERQGAWGAEWKAEAKGILDWSYATFRNEEYLKYGVTPLNEQTAYKVPGNSHTSRHASVELRYCEVTGDCATNADAIRRLNWATYMVDADGKNRYVRDDVWLTDGYGDYVRHYLRAMASDPDLAPHDQNHLLRTSSVIRAIAYGDDAIVYSKFDPHSRERFKLGAWEPANVTGGTMTWNAMTRVMEVAATADTVTVSRRKP
jgi:hypothetical protein